MLVSSSCTETLVLVNMDFVTVSIVVLLLSLILAADRRWRIKGIPGPPGVFLLGNALQFGGNFCRTMLDWKKIYGPVYQIRVFNKQILVLNDKESAVECFSKPETAGRLALPLIDCMNIRFGGGIGNAAGKQLEENRSFFMKAFKDCGMTKKMLEERLRFDIDTLLDEWTSKAGCYFDLRASFDSFVVNSVWNLMSSNRFNSREGSELMKTHMKVAESDTWGRKFMLMFPRLGEYLVADNQVVAINELTKLGRKVLEEHRRDRAPGQPRDILDMFLDKIDATTDPTSMFYKIGDKEIIAQFRDVQLGATTTTSHSFEWTIVYGCQYPETVRRLQEEIDAVIGPFGTPSLNHKDQMPYTEAFLLEATRMASILLLSVPHSAVENFEFRGNVIPKNTLIFHNVWGMNYDPEVWENPEEFRPERFLNAQGRIDLSVKNRMIPFGTGKRSCIGRVFAEDQTFLVVVSMYQKFTFDLEKPLDSLEGKFGLIYELPAGVRFRAVPRQ